MKGCGLFIVAFALLLIGCDTEKPSGKPDQPQANVPASVAEQYTVVTVTDAGKLHGRVEWSGEKPVLAPFSVTPDCASARAYNRLQTGPLNGVRDVVVMIRGITHGRAYAANSGLAMIRQQDCQYKPHASAVPVGSIAVIVNDQAMPHNVRVEDVATDSLLLNKTQPGLNRSDTFRIPYTGFFGLSCDYHPWMNGYVVGVDNPYYAVTDSSGGFLIEDIPAGDYRVHVVFNGIRAAPMKDNTGKIIRYRFDNPVEQDFPVRITKSVQTELKLKMTLKGIEQAQ